MTNYQICFLAYLKDGGAQEFYCQVTSDQVAGIEPFEWPVPSDLIIISASITVLDDKGDLLPQTTYFGFKWNVTLWEVLLTNGDPGMNRLNLDLINIMPDSAYRKRGTAVTIS